MKKGSYKTLSAPKQLLIKFIDFFGNLIFRYKNVPYSQFLISGPKKILLVEIWGIGDLVISTSAIVALKNKFPNSHLTILAKPCVKDILKNCPYVDEYISFTFPWTKLYGKYNFFRWDFISILALIRKLRTMRFDLAVSARMDIRDNFFLFLSGATRRVSFGCNGGRFFLTDNVAKDPTRNMHRIDGWMAILNYLNIEELRISLCLWLSEEEIMNARDFLRSRSITFIKPIIGIHVGASNKMKRWDIKRYKETVESILEKFSVEVLIFTDPDGYGKDLRLKGSTMISDISMRRLISLISVCNLFICTDGGPMHIAAALNVPTVAIFGPTNPDWFGPLGKNNRVIFKTSCPYYPCSEYCRFDIPICMSNIQVDNVMAEVKYQLSKILK